MLFDSEVTSGPVVMASTALAFLSLGVGHWQARLAVIPFALLALAAAYGLAIHLYHSRRAALLIGLIWLTTPTVGGISFLYISRQLLGETTALALVLLGLLLWFQSWDKLNLPRALAASLLLGLGLTCKMQWSLFMFPALGVVTLARSYRKPALWLVMFAMPAAALATASGWLLVEYLGTPPDMRVLDEATRSTWVQSLLLTGLFGQTLDNAALVKVSAATLALGTLALRLLRRSQSGWTERSWAEITLALILSAAVTWFAFFSVGWSRYFYFGWALTLFFLAKECMQHAKELAQRFSINAPLAYWVLSAGLALSLVPLHFLPAARQPDTGLTAMGRYLRANLLADARVISWEWELDALTGHRHFFRPGSELLNQAIETYFHEDQRAFGQLDYAWHSVDPDYVVIGSKGSWLRLMRADLQTPEFAEVAAIGWYTLYRRVPPGSR
jgi:hypothetical protein